MTSPATSPSMPALAKWGYVFSFLFSPLGLILSVLALGKYEDHPQAKRLARWGIVISSGYLLFFLFLRFKP